MATEISEAGNIEKFRTINKLWAKSPDIIKLSGCSRTKSYQIISSIQQAILQEGKKNVGAGTVPMERVIKYLGISKDAIYQSAMQEKELFGGGQNAQCN